ncbi:MAG TPA: single-stranded-DNA-specific exonuclease RecJ, partial [Cryomorphaceae bacterium]|nr:single-stranded-DNA-specific exonuclease RecJ [Cryomorphaceae bacterium]
LQEPSSGICISGIAFGMANKMDLVLSGRPLSVLYHLEENEFNGKKGLQLMVKDLKISEY